MGVNGIMLIPWTYSGLFPNHVKILASSLPTMPTIFELLKGSGYTDLKLVICQYLYTWVRCGAVCESANRTVAVGLQLILSDSASLYVCARGPTCGADTSVRPASR